MANARRAPGFPMLSAPVRAVAVAVAVVVLSMHASPAQAGSRVAMMPLVAESLLPSTRDELEKLVLDELRLLGHDVLSMDETRAQIEEGVRTGLDCTLLEDDCALRIGLVADVDVVLLSSVEVLDQALLFRAAWLDVVSKRGRRILGALRAPTADGGASLKNLVALLITGQGEPVDVPVRVQVDPQDAALLIDGTPTEPGIVWLKPGRHAARAQAAGRAAVERELDVAVDGLKEPVVLALPTLPVAQMFPWGLAAGMGLGVVGSVVAIGGGAATLLIDAGLADVMSRDERNEQQTYGRAAVVVTGAAAALAVGGLGIAIFLAEPTPTDDADAQGGLP